MFLGKILPWLQDRPDRPSIVLELSSDYFAPGDHFLLTSSLTSPYPDTLDVAEYIVLAVSGYDLVLALLDRLSSEHGF